MTALGHHVPNRFVDYFVVCGLDPRKGLETDQKVLHFSALEDVEDRAPLERSYAPSILTRAPTSVPWNVFDADAVLMLAAPHGVLFQTSRTGKWKKQPGFHSFVVTREDSSRYYGYALTFFEPVTDDRLLSSFQALQTMHFAEQSSQGHQGLLIHNRRSNSTSTSLPRNLGSLSIYRGGRSISRSPSRSRRSSVDEEGDDIDCSPRRRRRGTPKRPPQDPPPPAPASAAAYFDPCRDTLFVSKTLVFLTQCPFVLAAREILHAIHRSVMKESSDGISLESFLSTVLFQVPLPSPGRSIALRIPRGPSLLPAEIILSRPNPLLEPVQFEYPLRTVLRLLGSIENLLRALTCALLENQILLFSRDLEDLMHVGEALRALVFPFSWQLVYVPMVPPALIHLIDAPVPYIMGLPAKRSKGEALGMAGGDSNVCYVDLERGRVDVPEDTPKFPFRSDVIAELSRIFESNGIYEFERSADAPLSAPPHVVKPVQEAPRGRTFQKLRRKDRERTLSYDSDDSGMSSARSSLGGAERKQRESRPKISPFPVDSEKILETSETLLRVKAIATRTGVISDLSDLVITPSSAQGPLPSEENTAEIVEPPNPMPMPPSPAKQRQESVQFRDMKLNAGIREALLNRFVHIFVAYENFIIKPDQDLENWLNSGDTSMVNFDKVAFLSDQRKQHLPFLSRFLETQMFTTFIDRKILSEFGEKDPSVTMFDARIRALREKHSPSSESPLVYSPSKAHDKVLRLLQRRFSLPEAVIALSMSPTSQDNAASIQGPTPLATFPVDLNWERLNGVGGASSNFRRNCRTRRGGVIRRGPNSSSTPRLLSPRSVANWWMEADPRSPRGPETPDAEVGEEDPIAVMTSRRNSLLLGRQQTILGPDMSPAVIAHNNWTFVDQLLKETKSRTKRLLVEKLGAEAVELGHDPSVMGVEENTLIAGLGDLLERIWSHGRVEKKGPSSLWSHLLSFQELEEPVHGVDLSHLNPGGIRVS
ncbi:unnamed protein product [Cyprideis torosa]|uniref:Uncharacterized protein n=1 Tax=Cyprideis torosa TaxID=163714 RepID=A0A7R8WCA9_9CRUS|nr:unnamed protein product [Cyprideis torosa]CAG0893230.1 unnamed protein product [Cyprideis torosa]